MSTVLLFLSFFGLNSGAHLAKVGDFWLSFDDKYGEAKKAKTLSVVVHSLLSQEDQTNGDLVQPFGVCFHRFHPSCINSCLLQQKINCNSITV